MSNIIPCIFGTTKGFEFEAIEPLPFKMKDLLVAITHGEVELSLEDTCIKMLRIKAGSDVYTWIGLYRKAYEMGFSREGGYYGAGVWLSDTTVNARQVLDVLEDITQQIRRLALEDRKFQRPLSSIVQQLVPSQALSALLRSNAPYVKGGISADAKNCAFICQPHSARDIVNWAQNDALAHNFQSVIIAPASAFPKAGASGNITQYADVATLERALERDFTARLAKLDAQNKDLLRNVQTLEGELSQRKVEIQNLTQRNAELEGVAVRARLQNDKAKLADTDLGERKDFFSVGQLLVILPLAAILSGLLVWAALSLFWKTESNVAEAPSLTPEAVQSDNPPLPPQNVPEPGQPQKPGTQEAIPQEAGVAQPQPQASEETPSQSHEANEAQSQPQPQPQPSQEAQSQLQTSVDVTSKQEGAQSSNPRPVDKPAPQGRVADNPAPDANSHETELPSPADQKAIDKTFEAVIADDKETNEQRAKQQKFVKLSKVERYVLNLIKEQSPQGAIDLVGQTFGSRPLKGSQVDDIFIKLKGSDYIDFGPNIVKQMNCWNITEHGDAYLRSVQ